MSPKDFINKLVQEENIKVPSYYDLTDESDFRAFCYDTLADYGYYINNDRIYQIQNEEKDPNGDIFEYRVKESGQVEYEFNFYNGGTCLEEQVYDLINIIEEEN
jgi:hypothetical protein